MSNKKEDGKLLSNKKAQGLSVTTIILIVLGVVVLVVLIIGFTSGWSSISNWISPSNNLQEIQSQCSIACASGNTYDWCTTKRTVKIKDDNSNHPDTCAGLAAVLKYGVSSCNLNCPESENSEDSG